MPTIDIQAAIDAIVSDDFPKYLVLIGIDAFVEYQEITPGLTPDEADIIRSQNEDHGWYTEADFYEIEIEDKMNAIATASLVFTTLTEDELQDEAIRIYVDGEKRFTGTIKKCSKAYRSNEVSCSCLGIETEIQKVTIKEKQDLRNEKSTDIINKYLNPNDPTSQDGWLYSAMEEDDVGWGLEFGTLNNDFKLNWRIETGNILQQINGICNQNFWEWWIEEVDRDSLITRKIVHIASRRGLESPGLTFTLESSAYDAVIDKDKDKLKNAVLVTGSSSQASNQSTTASGFFTLGDAETPTAMGYVIGSESYLAQPVIIGAETIYLEDVSSYQTSGTVQIDDEEITYSSVDLGTNTMTITAATASHEVDTPVLMLSLMRAYVPESVENDSKKVWIGNELIEYDSVDYWGLHDLTRGATYDGSATPSYAHGDGTKIFNGENSLSNPATDSSIGEWGQVDSRISNTGSTDRDGLDKFGTSVLLTSQKYEQFGSFQAVLDDLRTLEIGDAFYLQEYGTGTQVLRRCMGLTLNHDIIIITFGLNEDYILNQFESVNRIDDTTYVKQDLDKSYEVLDISDDESSIKIRLEDGTEKWVTIR